MIKRIVVNGSFDIIHRGHIELLNFAKSLGDYLLVCIDTDRRISELKGSTRPINRLEDRLFMLSNFRAVDEVRYFDSADELEHILKIYQPDIMVKGTDYQGKEIVGADYCKEIVFMDLVNGYSTTSIIQCITNR
jgi:D-beta-D-heptose 7-phosphate kinase/D-beta-D-heptose 1-phosphate adenosyltransferase